MVPYGGIEIPVEFNNHKPTLESMVFILAGVHDKRNMKPEAYFEVKKVILVSDSLFFETSY
jgi:hypothetical protein